MYKIYFNDYTIYDPNLRDYNVLNPKLTYSNNSPDELTFTALVTNPNINKIDYLKDGITVYRDEKKIFQGRALNPKKNFNNSIEIECEGALSYFLDTIIRPYEFHNIKVNDYLQYLINQHNAQVDINKQFRLGRVTVKDSNDSLYRMAESYVTTWDEINDKLIDRLGGYIKIRYENDGNYIDYLREEDLKQNTQTIEFAKNLLDLTNNIEFEDIKTVLIPLGSKYSDTNKYVDIKSVNHGKDYIENTEAIKLYGRIVGTQVWDDVTTPSELLKKAISHLDSCVNALNTIEINAIDLSLLDTNIDSISVSEKVRVLSKQHNIDKYMIVNKYVIDMVNPGASKITLGNSIKTLTVKQVESNKKATNYMTSIDSIVATKADKVATNSQISDINSKFNKQIKYNIMGV